MPVRSERYYRSPSRSSVGVVRTAPGMYGIGSFRPGTGPGQQPITKPVFSGIPAEGGRIASWAQNPANPYSNAATNPALGGGDPLEEFIQQMMGMGGGNLGKPRFASDADLIAQARAEAAAQFNPAIAALNAAMGRAKSETSYNKSAIDQLYDQLASSYGEDISQVKSTYAGTVKGEKAVHKQAAKDIAGSYNTAEQDLANTMSQLGIEAAGPDVLKGIAKDEAQRLADEAARTATEQSAYGKERQGELSYYGQGPSLARMGSAEGQSALTQQLNQYLLDQQAQRAQLESQRTLTERAALGQYRQSAAKEYNDWLENQQQAQQQQFSNFGQIFNMMLNLRKFQADQAQQGQGETPTEGLQAAANVIGQFKPGDAAGGGKLMQDVQAVLAFNPLVNSYPYALAALKEFAKNQRISPTDLNTLSQALAAYFGKY